MRTIKFLMCCSPLILIAFAFAHSWRPSGNGIHIISPNAVVLEGEVVTLSWSANLQDFDNARAKFLELKKESP